jgi:hypothetical protein
MPLPCTVHRDVGLAVHDWRTVAFGTASILAGAAVPWLLWASLGRFNSLELAVAGLVSTAAYLRLVWLVGEQESAARRRHGRRYLPPAPRIAFAVCGGLVAALIAPGLSAVALIDAVGVPRAAGIVRSYESPALAAFGGTLDLMGVGLMSEGPLQLTPDGSVHLLARSGAAMPFTLSWRAKAGGLCIVIDQIIGNACLALDQRSGRLRDGSRDVGRVIAVGGFSADRRR